jgi:hypothetical protein
MGNSLVAAFEKAVENLLLPALEMIDILCKWAPPFHLAVRRNQFPCFRGCDFQFRDSHITT